MVNFSLENKIALITGGSRGIGLGIAQALAADGWNLAINGVRDEADVAEPLAALQSAGADTIYCRGNVAERDGREAIVARALEHFGQIAAQVHGSV